MDDDDTQENCNMVMKWRYMSPTYCVDKYYFTATLSTTCIMCNSAIYYFIALIRIFYPFKYPITVNKAQLLNTSESTLLIFVPA